MEWLNELVAQLWPNINNAVQKIVREQAAEKLDPFLCRIESTNTREVTPQLQASLPSFLKGAARFAVRSACSSTLIRLFLPASSWAELVPG